MNKYVYLNLLIMVSILIVVVSCIGYAANDSFYIDKNGYPVYETIRPTAPSTADPNAISDAISKKNRDKSKHIIAEAIVGPDLLIDSLSVYENEEKKGYTLIRYTMSIANVYDDLAEWTKDRKTDRWMLSYIDRDYMMPKKRFAENGFYRVKDIVYYFDKEGLMVTGLCKDAKDNYYYFDEISGASVTGAVPLSQDMVKKYLEK